MKHHFSEKEYEDLQAWKEMLEADLRWIKLKLKVINMLLDTPHTHTRGYKNVER